MFTTILVFWSSRCSCIQPCLSLLPCSQGLWDKPALICWSLDGTHQIMGTTWGSLGHAARVAQQPQGHGQVTLLYLCWCYKAQKKLASEEYNPPVARWPCGSSLHLSPFWRDGSCAGEVKLLRAFSGWALAESGRPWHCLTVWPLAKQGFSYALNDGQSITCCYQTQSHPRKHDLARLHS